jgi:hypothetical protein
MRASRRPVPVVRSPVAARSRALCLVLTAAAAFMAGFLLVETVRLSVLYASPLGFSDDLPFTWRFGSLPVQRLEHFLGLADGYLPPGSTVCFSSRLDDPDEELFAYLWAGFLLPRVTLRQAPGRRPLPDCSYWITWLTTGRDPGAETVLHTDHGVLYRLRR